MRTINTALIQAAAWVFSKNPNISVADLADEMEVSDKTIYKWIKTDEWHDALDALGYTGDRNFHREPTRDLNRDAGDLVNQAKQIYDNAVRDGISSKKAVTAAANELGLQRQRVQLWAKRFNWIGE